MHMCLTGTHCSTDGVLLNPVSYVWPPRVTGVPYHYISDGVLKERRDAAGRLLNPKRTMPYEPMSIILVRLLGWPQTLVCGF